jgi:hypothetical protein
MATDITIDVLKQDALDLLNDVLLFNNEQTVEQMIAAKDQKIADLTAQLYDANGKIAAAIAALQ